MIVVVVVHSRRWWPQHQALRRVLVSRFSASQLSASMKKIFMKIFTLVKIVAAVVARPPPIEIYLFLATSHMMITTHVMIPSVAIACWVMVAMVLAKIVARSLFRVVVNAAVVVVVPRRSTSPSTTAMIMILSRRPPVVVVLVPIFALLCCTVPVHPGVLDGAATAIAPARGRRIITRTLLLKRILASSRASISGVIPRRLHLRRPRRCARRFIIVVQEVVHFQPLLWSSPKRQ